MSDTNTTSAPKQSSFIKYRGSDSKQANDSNLLNITGCRTSVQNNQLLTSIGIPSIDYFIGGGLPVGSVCIIGEDTLNYYSDIICRCFIAEGILNKHEIFVADPLHESNHLLQRIPNVNLKESNEEKTSEKADSKLRIAWRYNEQQQKQTTESIQQNQNYFYLNKYMNTAEIDNSLIHKFKLKTDSDNETDLYRNLTAELTELVEKKFHYTKLKQNKNILRIVVNMLGSGFWRDNCYENGTSKKCFRFLYNLRQLLRYSLSVCLITVQNELINDQSFLSKISNLSDYVFLIDNSDKTKQRFDKTQYEGLFRITKLARLNTLNSYLPETIDLAFYIKRKRFIVEILALPPDISEDSDEKKGRTSTAPAMSCSSSAGGSSKLDF